MVERVKPLPAKRMRAKANAAVVDIARISAADMPATLIEFHSHSITGKGGGTTVPSARS